MRQVSDPKCLGLLLSPFSLDTLGESVVGIRSIMLERLRGGRVSGKEMLLFMKEVSWVGHLPWPPERVLHRGSARKHNNWGFQSCNFTHQAFKLCFALFPYNVLDFMQKSKNTYCSPTTLDPCP